MVGGMVTWRRGVVDLASWFILPLLGGLRGLAGSVGSSGSGLGVAGGGVVGCRVGVEGVIFAVGLVVGSVFCVGCLGGYGDVDHLALERHHGGQAARALRGRAGSALCGPGWLDLVSLLGGFGLVVSFLAPVSLSGLVVLVAWLL